MATRSERFRAQMQRKAHGKKASALSAAAPRDEVRPRVRITHNEAARAAKNSSVRAGVFGNGAPLAEVDAAEPDACEDRQRAAHHRDEPELVAAGPRAATGWQDHLTGVGPRPARRHGRAGGPCSDSAVWRSFPPTSMRRPRRPRRRRPRRPGRLGGGGAPGRWRPRPRRGGDRVHLLPAQSSLRKHRRRPDRRRHQQHRRARRRHGDARRDRREPGGACRRHPRRDRSRPISRSRRRRPRRRSRRPRRSSPPRTRRCSITETSNAAALTNAASDIASASALLTGAGSEVEQARRAAGAGHRQQPQRAARPQARRGAVRPRRAAARRAAIAASPRPTPPTAGVRARAEGAGGRARARRRSNARSSRRRAAASPRSGTTRPARSRPDARRCSSRRADLELARARLRQAELNLGYARVRTPVAGIVARKAVNVGDRVAPGQSLVAIAQIDRVWVTANFRETQIRRMRPGQTRLGARRRARPRASRAPSRAWAAPPARASACCRPRTRRATT